MASIAPAGTLTTSSRLHHAQNAASTACYDCIEAGVVNSLMLLLAPIDMFLLAVTPPTQVACASFRAVKAGLASPRALKMMRDTFAAGTEKPWILNRDPADVLEDGDVTWSEYARGMLTGPPLLAIGPILLAAAPLVSVAVGMVAAVRNRETVTRVRELALITVRPPIKS